MENIVEARRILDGHGLHYIRLESMENGVAQIQQTPMKGNEQAYQKLLNIPCYVPYKQYINGRLCFGGWFDTQPDYVARIDYINSERAVNYVSAEKFFQDYKAVVDRGEESQVEMIILSDLQEIVDMLKQI